MLSEEELKELYIWIDQIPLSRPKRDIRRDFSDGVLAAEIVHFFCPNLIELHNYPAVNSVKQKEYNWGTLNTKVLKLFKIPLTQKQIKEIASAQPETIEFFLLKLKDALNGSSNKSTNSPYQQGFKQERQKSEMVNVPVSEKSVKSKAKAKHSFKVMEEGDEIKNEVIQELKETIEILEGKVSKMDMLARLKDEKIEMLQNKLSANGASIN